MRALALALTLLLPAPALACPEARVLSCQIGKKQLELCATGTTLTYSFGAKGKPELTLTAAMADSPVEPWPGIGNSIWEITRFHNDATTYEVWISVEKPRSEADTPAIDAGINVLKGEDTLAELSCTPGTLREGGIFTMSDAMTNAGFCFDLDAQRWSTACP